MSDPKDTNSQELDVVRPFKADGIEEYDNPMPRWWVTLFYLTIVFGLIYAPYIHFFGGETLNEALEKDLAAMAEAQQEAAAELGGSGDLASRLRSPEAIAAGQEIYATNCSPCHAAEGQGLVGPNLTDRYWIHGGTDADIVKVIVDGVPEKGMIAWQPIIGPQKVEQVSAYVISLQGTNPQGGKGPEGEPYLPEGQ